MAVQEKLRAEVQIPFVLLSHLACSETAVSATASSGFMAQLSTPSLVLIPLLHQVHPLPNYFHLHFHLFMHLFFFNLCFLISQSLDPHCTFL